MHETTSILLLFAAILAFGSLGGYIATRLRLPAITGQIVVGILMGEAGLGIIPADSHESFYPITALALSLIAVTVGGHLEFRRLHNAMRRILTISVCQFMAVFWIVFALFQLFNPIDIDPEYRIPIHLLIASIATSSSPISIIHLVKEKRARGILVKTTVAVLAINNLLTILVFEMLHGVGTALLTPHQAISGAIGVAILGEIAALAIGLACGLVLVFYCRKLMERNGSAKSEFTQHQSNVLNGKMFTAFLLAICFASGLCEHLASAFSETGLHPSPVLANMMLGLALANTSSFKEDLLGLFQSLETGIFTFFFVLAGAHLDLHSLEGAWFGAVLLLVTRGIAMSAGGYLGGLLSKATKRNAAYIGRMLLSQGAIAITLAIFLKSTPPFGAIAGTITATIVGACVASEIFGPILMGNALNRTGEAEQDRARLIEFLQEEFIDPHVQARDKWEAIDSLCHLMCRTHNIQESPHEVLEAIREREQSMPTGIGMGIAVPHAKINVGSNIIGVLGRLEEPVDFGAEDGEPARIIIMIATPEDQVQQHIQVIAAVSKMMSNENIRAAVFSAQTAEEIHSIIDSEEVSTFNYFLEA